MKVPYLDLIGLLYLLTSDTYFCVLIIINIENLTE